MSAAPQRPGHDEGTVHVREDTAGSRARGVMLFGLLGSSLAVVGARVVTMIGRAHDRDEAMLQLVALLAISANGAVVAFAAERPRRWPLWLAVGFAIGGLLLAGPVAAS